MDNDDNDNDDDYNDNDDDLMVVNPIIFSSLKTQTTE